MINFELFLSTTCTLMSVTRATWPNTGTSVDIARSVYLFFTFFRGKGQFLFRYFQGTVPKSRVFQANWGLKHLATMYTLVNVTHIDIQCITNKNVQWRLLLFLRT